MQSRLLHLHEAHHARLVSEANAAAREAQSILDRSYEEGSLSSLFPDLYAKKVTEALSRQSDKLREADHAAQHVAVARQRKDKIGDAFRVSRLADDRRHGEREILELIEQRNRNKED